MQLLQLFEFMTVSFEPYYMSDVLLLLVLEWTDTFLLYSLRDNKLQKGT